MQFKIKIALVLVLFLGFQYTNGQNQVAQDSLMRVYKSLEDGIPKVETLEELFYNNVYNNPKAGEKYARMAQSLTKKIDYKIGLGVATYHLGVSKQLQNDLDSAIYYYNQTIKIQDTIKDRGRYASVIAAIADCERRRGNFEQSIKLAEKGTRIQKEQNDYLRYGIGVGNVGSIYYDKGNLQLALEKSIEALNILDTIQREPWRKADLQRQIGRIETDRGNYPEALNYLDKALKLYEETNDNVWQGYTLNDIGAVYLEMKDWNQAENYFKQGLKLAKAHDLKDSEFNTKGNLGSVFIDKGQYSKAKQYLEEALAYNQSINEVQDIISNTINLGRLHIKTKNYPKALVYLDKGLKITDSLDILDLKKTVYKYRAEAYSNMGLYENAYIDQKQFQIIADSLTKLNKSRQMDEIKTIYETKQKEKELLQKSTQIKLMEEREQKANSERFFIVITLLGILAFAISVIYGLRQKMKRNKLEREQLDANLRFKEKELTTHALHLAHKNEVLLDLKEQVQKLKRESSNSTQLQSIINNINLDINNDSNWQQFKNYFEDVHRDFNAKVMKSYPDISANDLRLMALLKMNLSSKEIASILNISVEGVKKARYRLRKKLNLNTEESLQEMVLEM